MVSSGLTFQRFIFRGVFTFSLFVGAAMKGAEANQLMGTMPEDYLPELKEILATAVKRSPEVVWREVERLAYEGRVDLANSARYPQVGGNFNYGMTETATAANTNQKARDSGFFYNFGVNQSLFHWGALKNQTAAARLSLLAHDKSYALAGRELVLLLRRSYLGLVAEKAALRQQRESVRIVENDVAIATAKKETGSISSAALEGEKLRLRESTYLLDRAQAMFGANRARFARLAGLGIPELPEEKIPADIPRPIYSEKLTTGMAATLLRDNASSTLEYEIYDLRLREATLRQKIEAVRLFPKFDANAAYNLENTTNVNGNAAEQRAVTRQTIGVAGSWRLFDGFATRGAKREALANKRVIEQRKAADIEQLLQNAQVLERALKLDAEQLELAEIGRGMAVEARRRVAEEVGFGNRPKGEIVRADVEVFKAEARSLEARANFLARWSEFVALAGTDPILNHLPARYVRAKN